MLTIRHYRIFQAVAECRNMSRAARQLYISQPTVSQTISEIEAHYNTKLFERYPRQLHLTPAGLRLLTSVNNFLYAYNQLTTMKLTGGKVSLRIGATHTIAETILPEILQKAEESSVNYDFSVNVTNTVQISDMIIKNELDFGIVEGSIQNPDIITMPVSEDILNFIVGPSHPLSGCGTLSLHDLAGMDFVLREKGSGTRRIFENLMEKHNVSYTVKWECASFAAIKKAVMNGRGIGIISTRMVKSEIAGNQLSILKMDTPPWKRNFFLCYHRNKYLSDELQPFINSTLRYSD